MMRVWVAVLLLAGSACKPSAESHSKAIIGAVLIDGAGGPPRSDSVVVVLEDRIGAAGARSTVPIPGQADKIDGSGKSVVPALVDMCDSANPAGMVRPATAEQARTQVAEMAARKAAMIHLAQGDGVIVEAALDAARTAGVPVTGHFTTQAGARVLVEHGATALVGMIRDTEELDDRLLARLRDLRIVVAPSLGNAGGDPDVAKRNTRRLWQAGVLLGVASEGGDPLREAELLVEAGVPPLDAIVAATRNGAMALRQLEARGTVEAGKRADLLLVPGNPGEDIRTLRRPVLKMTGGEWR